MEKIYFYAYNLLTLLTTLFILINAFFKATIGIDFLSKTMYLEDRTVSATSLYSKYYYS